MLMKKEQNKMIAGVCSGISEYTNVDVTIIRLIFVLLALSGGAGIAFYIIAMFIMPNQNKNNNSSSKKDDGWYD